MTSIAKLKDRARKHEQKEDWEAAIEAYRKVIDAEEKQGDIDLELGLFNRVGDLYLRVGKTDDAVAYYERAADKYAEAGFFNNAIALCNKALRHRPERAQIYLKLSRLCADQGFVTDARRWILDYAQRQVKAGRIDAALDGLRDFVDSSSDPDVREFLAGQLAKHDRADEAAEQYGKAYHERLERGETEAAQKAASNARAIDPAIDLDALADAVPRRSGGGAEGLAGLEAGGGSELGLESHRGSAQGLEIEAPGLEGLEGLETAAGAAAGAEIDEELEDELPGLELSYSEREPEATADRLDDAGALGGLETFDTLDDEAADEEAGAGPGFEDVEGEPLPFMEEEDAEPLPLLGVESPDDDVSALEDTLAEPEPALETGLGDQLEEIAELEDFGGPGEQPEPLTGLEPEEREGEEEAAEEPEEEVAALPALDFGDLGTGGTDLAAAAPAEGATESAAEEPLITPMDIDSLDLSFGGPVETPPAEPVAVDIPAIIGRARQLVSRALYGEALRELGILSDADEATTETFRQALQVVSEILRHEPDQLAALQRRVEFASRTGDTPLLVDAYLALAAALERSGAATKADAMYQRVLDVDPGNATALEALGAPPQPDEDDTVDIGALLRDVEPGPVAAREAPEAEGADPAFAAMLSQFKARVTEQGEGEDAGDHYDLGIAFKEMGLIDEAIAEFQTALTGGEERLKVYEELGQCFILKGQYTVALKIFNRALQVPREDPAELLGVYYHLGQCHEELGQREQAREAYARVLAIEPTFQDVPDRMARL